MFMLSQFRLKNRRVSVVAALGVVSLISACDVNRRVKRGHVAA